MPTLREIRRRMLTEDKKLGRIAPLTAAAAQSATALALGQGVTSTKWTKPALVRSTASTVADWLRWASAFNGATGAFTHTGTAYADTTATSELLEVHHFDPHELNQCIQAALRITNRLDTEIIPTRQGETHYPLYDLTHIKEPADVEAVRLRHSPVISRDRNMEKWGTVNTSGALQLDWWDVAGAAATYTRSTSNRWRRPYVVALVRAGTDCTFTQDIGVLQNGVTLQTLRGKTIYVAMVCRATVASRLRLRIYEDGSATASSSYHTGGSAYEELTATVTVGTDTQTLTFGASLETGDTTVQIADCYMVEQTAISDAMRLDRYGPGDTLPREYEQNTTPPIMVVPPTSRSRQIVVDSLRPYPTFDDTRVRGTSGGCDADGDSTDAPEDVVAFGAIAHFYLGRQGLLGADYILWNSRFEALNLKHKYEDTQADPMPLTPTFMAPGVRGRW